MPKNRYQDFLQLSNFTCFIYFWQDKISRILNVKSFQFEMSGNKFSFFLTMSQHSIVYIIFLKTRSYLIQSTTPRCFVILFHFSHSTSLFNAIYTGWNLIRYYCLTVRYFLPTMVNETQYWVKKWLVSVLQNKSFDLVKCHCGI